MSFWEEFGEMLTWMSYYAQLPEVVLTRREFNALPEYSCTVPSGVVPGKRWKRNDHAYRPGAKQACWLLGEYLPSDTKPETHCKTVWSRIIFRR